MNIITQTAFSSFLYTTKQISTGTVCLIQRLVLYICTLYHHRCNILQDLFSNFRRHGSIVGVHRGTFLVHGGSCRNLTAQLKYLNLNLRRRKVQALNWKIERSQFKVQFLTLWSKLILFYEDIIYLFICVQKAVIWHFIPFLEFFIWQKIDTIQWIWINNEVRICRP